MVAAAVIVAAAAAAVFVQFAQLERHVDPDAYSRTEDPQQVVVLFVVGIGDEIVGMERVETPAAVRISARVRQPGQGIRRAIGVAVPYPVRLDSPLGDRSVLGATTGNTVPERQFLNLRP